MPLSSLTESGSMKNVPTKRRILPMRERRLKRKPAFPRQIPSGREHRLDQRTVVHAVEAGLPILDLRDLAEVRTRVELTCAHHFEHALPDRPGMTEAALQRDRFLHER